MRLDRGFQQRNENQLMDNRVSFVLLCLVFSALAHYLLGCVQEVVGPFYPAKLSYVPIESLIALVYST